MVLALFLGAGSAGALVATAVYSVPRRQRAPTRARWRCWRPGRRPTCVAARRRDYYEGDLLGAAAIAALLLAIPFAYPEASWLAGVTRRRRSGCSFGLGAAAGGAAQPEACSASYDGRAMTMTNAVVLIEAERDALSTLGGALADIEGVAEAYSVTGEWDFVAIVRVPDHEQLADVVTERDRRRSRAWRARRRWSPSRRTRATTSRRCSRSGNDRLTRWRRCR